LFNKFFFPNYVLYWPTQTDLLSLKEYSTNRVKYSVLTIVYATKVTAITVVKILPKPYQLYS